MTSFLNGVTRRCFGCLCRLARLRCYCGHSKIISLNVTSSISTFLGKMLTLLASVMKKCIRQKERHRSTFSLLIFQSPLKLWDSNVHGRVGYPYFFQSDHKKKLNSAICGIASGQGFSWLIKNTFVKGRQNLWVSFPSLGFC